MPVVQSWRCEAEISVMGKHNGAEFYQRVRCFRGLNHTAEHKAGFGIQESEDVVWA